jgi:outer membrane lipoprotein SlyB
MKRHSNLVRSGLIAAALSSALVAACGSSPPREGRDYTNPNAGSVSTTNDNRQSQYGRVTRIDTVQEERRGVGVGTVIGAVVGGALGNQVGSGTGRAAATVAGAAGGAVVGNQVDRNRASGDVAGYDVYLRLDSGDSRVIQVADPGGLEVGERVRVEGSNIVRL